MRRMWQAISRVSVLSLLAVTLSACELPDWLGESDGPPLPGERISILSLERSVSADPELADITVRLPPPAVNAAWPQQGGEPDHAPGHLALGDTLKQLWSVSVGAGDDDERRMVNPPVMAAGKVFVLDANSNLTAVNFADGRRLWRVGLTPKGEERGSIGGGLAYWKGIVYATTAFGDVWALDAETGRLFWRKNIGIPMRAAPTVDAGRVFAVTYDNQLYALSAIDGSELWRYSGIAESAGLVGAGAAAVSGDVVVVPFSSGELVALRVENGRVAWSDTLTRIRRVTSIDALNDISGSPVIDNGRVYAASHAGRAVALSLREGRRIWDRDIGSQQSPWVAGDFLFLLSENNELVNIYIPDGGVRWVIRLPRYEDEEDPKSDPVTWYGPVLAGEKLIVASSNGLVYSVSPYDGRITGRMTLDDGVGVPPVVVAKTLLILTENASLIALR